MEMDSQAHPHPAESESVRESSESWEQRRVRRSPRSESAAPSPGGPLSFLSDPKGGLAGTRSVEANLGSQSDLLDRPGTVWSKAKQAQRKFCQ